MGIISKAFLLALISLLSTFVPVAMVRAQAPTGTLQYVLGTGLLCSLDPHACPDIAKADNGDTVDITGQGTLSVHAKSVSGTGTFVHKDPQGNPRATGTWAALQLLSFKSYGNSTTLPSNFEGGLALIRVQLLVGGTPVHTAILQVDCLVGNPPAGAIEGVRLAVQDTPFNFNKEVSGFTLFIRQA